MKNKKYLALDEKRKSLTFLHLVFPVIILAILSFISTCNISFGTTIILIITKILLVLWQIIALRNFIESVY